MLPVEYLQLDVSFLQAFLHRLLRTVQRGVYRAVVQYVLSQSMFDPLLPLTAVVKSESTRLKLLVPYHEAQLDLGFMLLSRL